MVKLIGLLLIASSVLSLLVGAYIEAKHATSVQITGNVVTNILVQPPIAMNFYDYLAGSAFSYSIVSLIIGFMLLFRV